MAVSVCWIANVLSWSADNLVAPVLTGVFVGLALRTVAIAGEPRAHDARAEEMNSDLSRWVADRERQLTAEIFRAKSLAEQGIIEDVEQPPVPKELKKGSTPGSQVDSGAFVNRVERLMRQALHEYRDDASLKVRIYCSMARSEGWFHRLLRRMRRESDPSPFGLTENAREILETWRKREVPSYYKPTATVKDDPTRAPDAAEIAPLESPNGLTWSEAANPGASSE